ADQKAQVETQLAEQESRRSELVELKATFDGQKKEQAGLVKNLEAEQQRLAAEKGSLENQRSEVIEISADLEQQVAAEQARLAEIARQAEEERQRKLAAEKAKAEAAAREAARAKAAREAEAAKSAKTESVSTPKAEDASVSAPKETVAQPSSNGIFIRPISGRYSSGFGGRDIGAGAESHLGQDIANVTGTPISAAAS